MTISPNDNVYAMHEVCVTDDFKLRIKAYTAQKATTDSWRPKIALDPEVVIGLLDRLDASKCLIDHYHSETNRMTHHAMHMESLLHPYNEYSEDSQDMKIKQYLVITNPAGFLKGDFHSCFALYGTNKHLPDDWTECGQIEIDVNVDTGELIKKAQADIDANILKAQGVIEALERKKAELLALPAPTEEWMDGVSRPVNMYPPDESREEIARAESAVLDAAERL